MRLVTKLLYLTALICLHSTIQAVEIRGLDNKCLDAAGESAENGTHIILWECTGRENQQWYFTEQGELRGIGNKCIDAAGGSSKNGTQLILWSCNGKENQQWQLTTDGLIQGMANKCFDMTGNSSENGTKITLWKCHGKENQRWYAVANKGNWGSSGNQREKKRWYHDNNNNNNDYRRQSSAYDQDDHDSRNERGERNNNRWQSRDNSSEYDRWDQKGNKHWKSSNKESELVCQNLYDIHNQCYATGVTSEGSVANRAKMCSRAVDNVAREIGQSSRFARYGEVAATVCSNACNDGISGKGSPSYDDFKYVCNLNGL